MGVDRCHPPIHRVGRHLGGARPPSPAAQIHTASVLPPDAAFHIVARIAERCPVMNLIAAHHYTCLNLKLAARSVEGADFL